MVIKTYASAARNSVDDTPSTENLFRLNGRVALVTGASSGLGDRFARVLAAAGAEVVLLRGGEADRLETLSNDLGGADWSAGDLAGPAVPRG